MVSNASTSPVRQRATRSASRFPLVSLDGKGTGWRCFASVTQRDTRKIVGKVHAGARRWSCSAAAPPSNAAEIAHPLAADDHPFGGQERAFQQLTAAVPAEAAAGRDDAVTRNVRPPAVPHDIAHGARRARTSRHRRDITVGGDAAGRNPPNDHQDAGTKPVGRGFHFSWRADGGCDPVVVIGAVRAVRRTWPATSFISTPHSAASVGATSAGVTAAA